MQPRSGKIVIFLDLLSQDRCKHLARENRAEQVRTGSDSDRVAPRRFEIQSFRHNRSNVYSCIKCIRWAYPVAAAPGSDKTLKPIQERPHHPDAVFDLRVT